MQELLVAKVREFQDQRDNEAKKKFVNVVSAGGRITVLGILCFVAGRSLCAVPKTNMGRRLWFYMKTCPTENDSSKKRTSFDLRRPRHVMIAVYRHIRVI